MKIQETIWFTQGAGLPLIGIVLGEDEVTGKHKAYIGTGEGVFEEQDTDRIAKWGAKVHMQSLSPIIEFLAEEPTNED